MTALGDRIAAAKRHPADLSFSEWVELLEDVEKKLRCDDERPGGWVPGIGWVALAADLSHRDWFTEGVGQREFMRGLGELHPSPVIVTRWADGSVPGEPS